MQSLLNGSAIEDWVEHVRDRLNLPAQLRLWTGAVFALGRFETPAVEIRVRDAAVLPLLFDANLDALGEAYVKQRIDVNGELADIVDVALRLSELHVPHRAVVGNARAQPRAEDSEYESIRYHYDLSNDFYRLWLDENMVYASARFERADESLESAQLNAIDRTLDKLRLRPGQTLLDASCGWGALVIRAAQRYGVRCVGVTRSEHQYQLATERVRAAGLSDRVEIRLADYRALTGRFDRIVSVGLGAPVGRRELAERFAKLQSLLADDGIVMTHSIASTASADDAPPLGDQFIGRYVFPSAEPPHVSFALRAMQHGGLESLDMENLRGHYARTLQCWAQRFEQNAERIRQTVGETKYRIWRVYLAGRAYAFAAGRASIYQIVAQKAGRTAACIPWPRTDTQRERAAASRANCAPADDSALYSRGTPHASYAEDLPQARSDADASRRQRLVQGEAA